MEADYIRFEPKVDFTRRGCDSFAGNRVHAPRRSVKVELGFAPRRVQRCSIVGVRSYDGDTTAEFSCHSFGRHLAPRIID